MKISKLFISSFVMLGACASGADTDETTGAATPSAPNIIVILADDLGWGDISLNGAELIKTPNIDRIGREGMQLTAF